MLCACSAASAAGKSNFAFSAPYGRHAESWNVCDSLGEAQETAGDEPGAIASYHKSLALNPQNYHAQARLKELEAKTQ